MLNEVSRPWLLGGWMAVLAVVVMISIAMDANVSTTILVVALGIAPAVIVAVLQGAAPSPTVAEILYAARAKDGRP